MNIQKVAGNCWRSAAPNNKQELSILFNSYGIKQVICLQEGWSWLGGTYNGEKDFEALGGIYHKQSFSNFFPPTKDELEALSKMIDEQPTLVHCKAGVDRTGMLCGYYLVTRGGFSPEHVWEYIKNNGMHIWYQIGWKRAFFEAVK